MKDKGSCPPPTLPTWRHDHLTLHSRTLPLHWEFHEDWTCLGQHKRHPEFPVVADVGKHWPLVWFLLPALQHQIVPGGTNRWVVTIQQGLPSHSHHTQYSAPWAPEAVFPNPKAVPVSLTSSSELGQGMMGQQGLTVSGAVVQPCSLWQLLQKCQSLKLL